MANLSDYIEDYLKKLLALSSRRYVDIQRHELARKFSCVPSQINYVLASRFSLERGYLVESRRGGRGYIRVYRIDPLHVHAWEEMMAKLEETCFDPAKAGHFLSRAGEEKIISRREARMLETLFQDEHYTVLDTGQQPIRELQKKLFLAALEAILKESY